MGNQKPYTDGVAISVRFLIERRNSEGISDGDALTIVSYCFSCWRVSGACVGVARP